MSFFSFLSIFFSLSCLFFLVFFFHKFSKKLCPSDLREHSTVIYRSSFYPSSLHDYSFQIVLSCSWLLPHSTNKQTRWKDHSPHLCRQQIAAVYKPYSVESPMPKLLSLTHCDAISRSHADTSIIHALAFF